MADVTQYERTTPTILYISPGTTATDCGFPQVPELERCALLDVVGSDNQDDDADGDEQR